MSHPAQCCLEIIMGALGAVIGIGRMMISTGNLTVRHLVGRAIVSGGIGIAAGAILLLIPKAPVAAVIGLSAACATLGTDGIERILVRYYHLDRRRKRQDK